MGKAIESLHELRLVPQLAGNNLESGDYSFVMTQLSGAVLRNSVESFPPGNVSTLNFALPFWRGFFVFQAQAVDIEQLPEIFWTRSAWQVGGLLASFCTS
jgi:hypothetical protein